MATQRSLRIDVWSDIACPWCWVGKRHLESALEGFAGDASVVWRAFELDPGAPLTVDPAIDYVERLARKYRTDRAGAQTMIDRMTEVGASVGLDFRFDRIRPTNTFDAHRLLHWSGEEGRQDALKEQLLAGYMTEGRWIGEHATLVALCEQAGLEPRAAGAVLSSGRYGDEVRADEDAARQMGVTGVPFFVIGGRYVVSGAQPPEVLRRAMERCLFEVMDSIDEGDGLVCGPEGCAVPARNAG